MSSLKVSHENFIRIWQASGSVIEVAEKVGLSRMGAYKRAHYLRSNGVHLKDFRHRRKVDWEPLRQLAEELLEE